MKTELPNVGDQATARDGSDWRIDRLLKGDILKLRRIGNCPDGQYGEIRRIPAAEWSRYRAHVIPVRLRKGDVLMWNGDPVLVISFRVLGGQPMAGMAGRWGSAAPHAHENLIPLSVTSLLADGFRKPFPSEKSEVIKRKQELQQAVAQWN